MKRNALGALVCPTTGDALQLRAHDASDDDVHGGELVAGTSTYPIRNGIPSFCPPELADDQTVRSFAQKWGAHDYYRDHTRSFYTDWYLQRYGFADLDELATFLGGRDVVLDAGTGAGRDAVNFAELSSAHVYAVDAAWEALTTAARGVDDSRISFVHADIARLPFPDAFFDFISCDQVIHHTGDPHATFEHLSRKLKPGGQICVYVYRRKAVLREFSDDYVRERISSLSVEQALEACEAITRLGKALADLDVTLDVPQDIPVLGIPAGPIDLQRFFHWNVMKCFWNDDFDFFTNNIVNVDWYHPENCFRFEPAEFRSWFDDGFEIRHWDEQESGLSCRAEKI